MGPLGLDSNFTGSQDHGGRSRVGDFRLTGQTDNAVRKISLKEFDAHGLQNRGHVRNGIPSEVPRAAHLVRQILDGFPVSQTICSQAVEVVMGA